MSRKLEIVGLAEIADMAGVPDGTARQWHHRDKLPHPDAFINGGRTSVWRRSTIVRWLEDRR